MEISEFKAQIEEIVNNKVFTTGIDRTFDIVKFPVTGYAVMQNKERVRVRPLFKGSDLKKGGWELIRVFPVPSATYSVAIKVPISMCFPYFFEDMRYTYQAVGMEIEGHPHPDWEEMARDMWKFYLYQMCEHEEREEEHRKQFKGGLE